MNISESVYAVTCVEKEIEKVLFKFSSLKDHASSTLTNLIQQLQDLQQEFEALKSSGTPTLYQGQKEILQQSIKKVKDVITQIASEHRDLHGTVSKVGKAIDKNFTPDYASVANDALFDEPSISKVLNQVIVEHFLRQGMLEIAEQLIIDSKLEIPDEKKNLFTELNMVLDALKRKDLKPALEWAAGHREELAKRKSMLEFKLHRLQFIDYLMQGPSRQSEIIKYAREQLQPLAHRHEKEIQALMGSLLYLKSGLSQSAYSYLVDPANWGEICDIFTRDACALLGLSVESPLTVAFNAGCTAMPALLNIKQVMQQRKVTSVWSSKDELPIEVDLGRNCQFHSIFACPILRQQSTENNPPMRLVCGHVISRDALHKLTNGSKLKCPYCPVEQNPNDAQKIYF
ncbi:E3 ubiquitin-protein ligase RMND5A [Halotydeus destructor]|nr:E3 ubiquitin-protein ligase RMND5A [Halotydeus destructor]